MPKAVTRIIDAPADRVWDQLTRVAGWPRWGPSVVAVECADEVIRLGSQGRVRTALGIWLPFRITEFVPGRFWGWRVAGIRATGHRVESLGPNQCRLSFDMPYWAALYAPVCRRALDRIARNCAAEAEHRGRI